jgi:hypothetical protein
MERRNFIKRLFGIGAAAALASVPVIAKTNSEETFKIDDIFEPCDGNKQLFYLKTDSWLEKEIRDVLGERFVDEKYFSYYCPIFNCYLPIKDEYTRKDFEGFLLTVKTKKYDFFCDHVGNHGKQYGAMRLFKEERDVYYKIDMYQARKPNN